MIPTIIGKILMQPRAILRIAVLFLASAAALLLLLSGPGHRFGYWSYGTGFRLLRWAGYAGSSAALLAIVALATARVRGRWNGLLIGAFALGAAAAFVPWKLQHDARAVPPIHDITTDTEHPPPLVALLARRAGAPNSADYGGRKIAEAQRKAYPDIAPLMLALPPQVAFTRALDVARELGWDVAAADAASGRIEATATTLWFGFQDDVVIRVSPAAAGSRVDVRSVSRVGRSDLGTNAARVRAFLANLRG